MTDIEQKEHYEKLFLDLLNDMSFMMATMKYIMKKNDSIYQRYIEMEKQLNQTHLFRNKEITPPTL